MDLFDIAVAKKMSGGGGGGSSDFSTAKLTIVNTTSNTYSWAAPYFIDDVEFSCSYGDISVPISGSEEFNVILYKGMATVTAQVGSRNITLSGDIEHDGGPYYILTGDCTMTIS